MLAATRPHTFAWWVYVSIGVLLVVFPILTIANAEPLLVKFLGGVTGVAITTIILCIMGMVGISIGNWIRALLVGIFVLALLFAYLWIGAGDHYSWMFILFTCALYMTIFSGGLEFLLLGLRQRRKGTL
jgi:hypothetical protein